MAGRPRKPTKVKELQGTLEKSRVLENEMQTKVITKVPDLEDYYPEETHSLWKMLCSEMINIGMLQIGDLEALKAFTAACYMQGHAFQMMQEQGAVLDLVNSKGEEYKKTNPWVSVWKESVGLIKSLGNEFGFTPASRSKLEMPKEETSDNPLDNINKMMGEALKELKKVG